MIKYGMIALATVAISGCGGGGGSSNGSSGNESSNTPTATTNTQSGTSASSSTEPTVVLDQKGELKTITSDGTLCTLSGPKTTVSGTVHYERVPFSSTLGAGLDYDNIQTLPMRGVHIQALGPANCIMSTDTTSDSGTYSLTVTMNQAVTVRIKAQTIDSRLDRWDFEVRDNTNSNALYVLDGAVANTGTGPSVRNIVAQSGWTGSAYGDPRSAAPFAIIDSIYTAIEALMAIDFFTLLDDADIFWSVNNNTASGSLANGEITSSFYSNDRIYLLGQANSDADEYDQHVIIHEFGHYLEDNLSRSDSIGGSHTVFSKLDGSVALGEGFGNALSGIITGDPIYRDSTGLMQASDFQIDVESNAFFNIGSFNEGSVQTILYDIADADSDANDTISLGLSSILNAMTSVSYLNQTSFTSIYSLMNTIKSQNPTHAADMDALLASQLITVNDNFGTGETNNGGNADDLPVYKLIADDGVPVMVCSNRNNGEYNRLGNRQLLRLNVASSGPHTIAVTRISGLANSNPNIGVYDAGSVVILGRSNANNSEIVNTNLAASEFVIEVYANENIDNDTNTGGTVCYNVSVS